MAIPGLFALSIDMFRKYSFLPFLPPKAKMERNLNSILKKFASPLLVP
jgi:hypothetical protein